MVEKPKKKLPDGTLVDVDILAAEATKAEQDINGVPLVNRVGEVYTHPEKQNTLVVVYNNGVTQEYVINNVSEANHASTTDNADNANTATKAEQDINGVPLAGRIVGISLERKIDEVSNDTYDIFKIQFEDGSSIELDPFGTRYAIHATRDGGGNVIANTYVRKTGGEITGDIKLNGVLYSNRIYSINHYDSNGIGAQAIVCDETGGWHVLTGPSVVPNSDNLIVVKGELTSSLSELRDELISLINSKGE